MDTKEHEKFNLDNAQFSK